MSTEAIHLDDGDVVRLLDDAASPEEREAWRAHLAGCARCDYHIARESKRLDAVSAEIALLELPAGTRRPMLPPATEARPWWSEGWMRAAAALVVLVAVVATVEPLRAWVADGWDALAAAVLGEEDAAPAVASEPAPTSLWFEASAATFSVEVSARQAAGTLTLRRSDDRRGMLEIRGGASPLLSERGVRIETSAGSTASYVVAVPSSVREVRVRVADGAERTVTREEIERGLTLELGGR